MSEEDLTLLYEARDSRSAISDIKVPCPTLPCPCIALPLYRLAFWMMETNLWPCR